jgi:hypothetical protein
MIEKTNQQQKIDIVKLWTELTGKPYIPSWETDIRKTFFSVCGWIGKEERANHD